MQTKTFLKQTALLLSSFLFYITLTAQTPPLKQWDKTFGGNSIDQLPSIQQTSDGGYILGGYSYSDISGDKTQNNYRNYDYWIVKVDANGTKQWDKTFGGNDVDLLTSLRQTSDGGYILGGFSQSNSGGDKSENSQGDFDYWIIKVDANGAKQWDKTFGGSGRDDLKSIRQTKDGTYIVAGYSNSNNSGDKTEDSRGDVDYWIVKVDANGTKQWDKTFGGSSFDQLYSLEQTSDDGYILGGSSYSILSGDKTQNSNGGVDYWIVKVDANGTKQWDKTFGGNDNDQLYSLQQTSDGGYILGGDSNSPLSADKSENGNGNYDYWIVKVDASGIKQWDKTFGGSGFDLPNSVQQTSDGGYILGGYSSSGISGDKTEESRGNNDYWIVKVNASGKKQWDNTFGGSGDDGLTSLQQTADDGYILGGYSNSNANGDKTENSRGGYDYWIIKLCTTKTFYQDGDGDGYGNPAVSTVDCTKPDGYVTDNTDCDDSEGSVHPGATEICGNGVDENCNGMADDVCELLDTDKDGDPDVTDCAPSDPAIHHGAIEVCNGKDDNCDGKIDEGVQTTYYKDADKDGYGNKACPVKACSKPAGYVNNNNDCNDNDNTIYPGAPELCDNKDNDCDGKVDENLAKKTYYRDYDKDGYGDYRECKTACKAPYGYVEKGGDCNDHNNKVYPYAKELCDGLDNNCNGKIDEYLTKKNFYRDYDCDGYGDANKCIVACAAPPGYVSDKRDGDDYNKNVHPYAKEICDGVDNDCDGKTDEGFTTKSYFKDYDKDGYGDPKQCKVACSAPSGYVTNNDDCSDRNKNVHPGCREIAGNKIDDNCNGKVDESSSYASRGTNDESIYEQASKGLRVNVLPNPSPTHFTLNLKGGSDKGIELRVVDISGRLVEIRRNIATGSTVTIGTSYLPGVYFVEVTQGSERLTVKCIKQ